MLSALFRCFIAKPASVKVLVVCMENICRSPLAEGVLKQALFRHGLLDEVQVDSAGTLASQPGSRPDVRAVKVAMARGIDISGIRSRRVKLEDYYQYHYILAVDNEVLFTLNQNNPSTADCKIMSLMSFVKKPDICEIPDPYFGNNAGFERVMDLIEQASDDVALYLIKHDL